MRGLRGCQRGGIGVPMQGGSDKGGMWVAIRGPRLLVDRSLGFLGSPCPARPTIACALCPGPRDPRNPSYCCSLPLGLVLVLEVLVLLLQPPKTSILPFSRSTAECPQRAEGSRRPVEGCFHSSVSNINEWIRSPGGGGAEGKGCEVPTSRTCTSENHL